MSLRSGGVFPMTGRGNTTRGSTARIGATSVTGPSEIIVCVSPLTGTRSMIGWTLKKLSAGKPPSSDFETMSPNVGASSRTPLVNVPGSS